MKKKYLGVMIDCSRNAVINLSTVKKLINIISKMGYNSLFLYTEDTYEVPDEPYFGYMRGRFSGAELKEIDAYAATKGIELVPCIQTLAHFDSMVRWSEYWPIVDCDNILLAGNERTYDLIDKMFKSLAQNFSSRIVNIGMDEAHMLGRGKYADEHGFVERFKIMSDHLKRVVQIAEKYGFQPIMWSDMFFRLATGDYNPIENHEEAREIRKLIPDRIGLIYWNYTNTKKEQYNKMIDSHFALCDNVWFAGGLWSWEGFAPLNRFSIKATKAAMESCLEKNVHNIVFTMWGDNGKECSFFSLLPSLMVAAMTSKGITDETVIKDKFKEITGENFDEFLKADLPNYCLEENIFNNRSKYLFYDDYFIGMYVSKIKNDYSERLKEAAWQLKKANVSQEFRYLFDYLSSFSLALSLKCKISLNTYSLYRLKDKQKLTKLLSDYDEMTELLRDFYEKFRAVWNIENKPYGFEVQDIRIGGLIQRTKHCRERLNDYIIGKVPSIPELEDEHLTDCNFDSNWDFINNWGRNVTCCLI